MIMLLAGLQGVPDQLHRAARVDGAGTWARFWHITMPHLKGVSIVTILLLLLTNLNSFTLVWIMTGGGPAGSTDIWITQIYQLAFGRTRFGVASAYSVILFLVMMSLGYFYVKALTRGDDRNGRAHELQLRTNRRLPQALRCLGHRRLDLPLLLMLFTVVPLAWMLSTSRSRPSSARCNSRPAGFPKTPRWTTTGCCSIRTTISAGASCATCSTASGSPPPPPSLGVCVAVPAAYAFSRFRFPGKNALFYGVLLRNMFPAVIFLIPLFILMRNLHLVNSYLSLIITYLTFGLPLSIWLLKGFYDNIPVQLEQAARIDGATRFQAFLYIVMPLSAPGIVATAIYSFILAWNEYVYALTFITDDQKLTVPVGLQRFFSEFVANWPGLMAAAFLMSVPVVVMFLVLQKYFVRALTEGAVKQ